MFLQNKHKILIKNWFHYQKNIKNNEIKSINQLISIDAKTFMLITKDWFYLTANKKIKIVKPQKP